METLKLPQTIQAIKDGGFKLIYERSMAAANVRTRELLNIDIVTSKKVFNEGNQIVYAFYKPGNDDPYNTVYAVF